MIAKMMANIEQYEFDRWKTREKKEVVVYVQQINWEDGRREFMVYAEGIPGNLSISSPTFFKCYQQSMEDCCSFVSNNSRSFFEGKLFI